MLAAPEATALPWNLPRITSRTEALFCSACRRHKSYFFIAPSELRPWRDCAGITRSVSAIGILVITAPAAQGLKALPRQLGSTQPRPWLKITLIVIGKRNKKIKIWARLLVTIVIKRAILPTNAFSPVSQKTSISFDNLLVNDWCWYRGFEGESSRQDFLHLLPCLIPQG